MVLTPHWMTFSCMAPGQSFQTRLYPLLSTRSAQFIFFSPFFFLLIFFFSVDVHDSLGPVHLLGSSLQPMLLALVGINTVCTVVHYCQEFGMGLAEAGRMRASATVKCRHGAARHENTAVTINTLLLTL